MRRLIDIGSTFEVPLYMTSFSLPKLDKPAIAALLLLALAVPIYAASSYEGTSEVSVSRWLALYIVGTEVAVIFLALFSGWHPLVSFKRLPGHVRIAFILWLVGASAATAFSSHSQFSGTFQLFWFIHGLFSLALWAMIKSQWVGIERALLIYISVGLIFHSIMVYFVAIFVLGLSLEAWEPYSVGTTNPRLYTFYAAVLLGIGLGFLIAETENPLRVLSIICIFSAYHLFAWAGGRASFGTSIIVPMVVAILAAKARKRIVLTTVACASIAYPLSLFTAPTHEIYGFKSIMGGIAAYSTGDAYSSGRFDIWARMLSQSLEKPLFGHGQIGTLDLLDEMLPGAALNAHNAVVHILHAWGAFGLVAFAIGVVPFLPTIGDRLETNPRVAWPAFSSLLALGATSTLDGTLFYNQPLFFCALFLAILASVPVDPRQDTSNSGERGWDRRHLETRRHRRNRMGCGRPIQFQS
ncbi:MAG: O-antigen ligase family protein [Alphaproteobacteria bacterium]|nr:O-antigen ligase family protein [Alphaproteobacteria bacterium]